MARLRPTAPRRPGRSRSAAATDRHARFSPDGTHASRSSRTAGCWSRRSPTGRRRRRTASTATSCSCCRSTAARRGASPTCRGASTTSPGRPTGARWRSLSSSLGATVDEDTRKRGRPADAEARRDAAVRLPLHRPPRLPVQRRGLHRRPRRHLWLVDVDDAARPGRWSRGPHARGRARLVARTAPGSRSPPTAGRTRTSTERSSVFAVDVATGDVTTIAGGPDAAFFSPTWTARRCARSSPSATGSRGSATGPGSGGSRPTARTRAGAAVRDLLARSELKPDAALNSDVTLGEGARLVPGGDGASVLFTAPVDGSYELWRVSLDGRPRARAPDRRSPLPVRLGRRRPPGRRTSSSRSTPPRPSLPEVVAFEAGATARATTAPRRLSARSTPSWRARSTWIEPRRPPLAERRPRDPGLALPGRRRAAAARARDPRRPAHALRLRADARVADPRRVPACRCWPRTRAAPRATARRSTAPTSATGATARWLT